MKICPRCVLVFDDSLENCPECAAILQNKYCRPGAVECLVAVRSAASAEEIESIKSLLTTHGIQPYIKKPGAAEATSRAPTTQTFEIFVRQSELAKARSLLNRGA